jgi:hypothetical protein
MAKLKTRYLSHEVLDVVTKRNERLFLELAQKARKVDRAAKAEAKLAEKAAKLEAKIAKMKGNVTP